MSVPSTDASLDQGNSLYAAIARTTTRGVALYFSRPMRLFRPSKVSGWQSIRGLAAQQGSTLTPRYLFGLVRDQGLGVIPKHFLFPLFVNAALGTVLWTAYAETSTLIDPNRQGHILVSTISGAAAGGAQAVLAAPAENVRVILEGGSGSSWTHAWKEVFRGSAVPPSEIKEVKLREIREVRNWVKDVKGMAGRGWEGWGWGCAKDMCGFAAFFTVFEVTRRLAVHTKAASQGLLRVFSSGHRDEPFYRHFPRTVHGITLVSGGVAAGLAYELVSRPWEIARKVAQLDRSTRLQGEYSAARAIANRLRAEGPASFLRDPASLAISGDAAAAAVSPGRRRLLTTLRTFARVGPWGIGFLVWEAFGPGLS